MKNLKVIYGLFDPREPSTIRYVGKTIIGERARRSCHLQDAKKGSSLRVSCWIRELLAEGIEPEVIVIEECTKETVNQQERFHIARLRGQGLELLNKTKGGTGGPTMKGRKFTEEHRRRIAVALYNHPVSEDSRRKASERLTKINPGKAGTFKKGHVPHNKGFKN